MAEISKQALKVQNNQSFPDNNSGEITPSDLRTFNVDVIDSTVNQIGYTADSSSWNSKISSLQAFTASQQPSFNALNAFTASQTIINTNLNAATSSLSTSIGIVSSEVDQLQTWSGSVNEIIASNVSLGYATRFNFSGFITASLVNNVNGKIADISVTADSTKTNTSSFNAYTQSTDTYITNNNAKWTSLAPFTASVTASVQQLLNFSSSLSGGFATQGELDASASALQNNIDTKLNTSSFNAYTQSFSSSVATSFSQSAYNLNQYSSSQSITNEAVSANIIQLNLATASLQSQTNALISKTGSYATTGSNTFVGNKTISGSASGVVIPLSIASNTASMDLALGNFFTLNLVSGSSTHLTASNIKPGQTINLLITQSTPASGSLTYSSTFKFPNGAAYVQTDIAGAKDILSFLTFDNSTIYSTPVNNLI